MRNFAAPDAFAADRLIAVEVITPGGNWSSYPPHKHDEVGDSEVILEEIYYYVCQPGPLVQGLGTSGCTGTPDRRIDVLAEVRDGDVVLTPTAGTGRRCGPPATDVLPERDGRAWQGPRLVGSPRLLLVAWVRGTWADQEVRSRLAG